MTITLQVALRSETGGRLKKLRQNGELPAVVYGPKEGAAALKLNAKEFEKVFKEAGESSVLILSGAGDDKEVLVHDISFDRVRGTIEHVDFYAIEKGKEVTVRVPLVFVGEAPAVKLGGSVTKALFEVEVTCKPKDLPHEISVNVEALATLEDSIRVKDLSVPSGVKISNDPEETVAVITETKEEPEEPAAIDMSAIEVEKKGKDETAEDK